MKTSLKIWCQPISAREWTSKTKWLAKTELGLSEISEFSILTLYLNRKLGNIYNTCKFQGMCFTWGSWKFPSFRFWPLYWNRKLGKLRNFVLSEFFYFRKLEISKVRSSHRKCSVKKVFLKGFTNLTGKHQENTRPQECNFIKKENPTQAFSLEIWEILKNIFFKEHLRATASIRLLK